MRKFSTGRLGVVLTVVSTFLVAAAPMVAAPAAHAAKTDNATEMKAREAFAAGRYDEALDLFAKLYAQTLHPVYLRNIGRCHQKMRQPEQAIDKFNEYLVKEKKISADERKEIDGYIKDMETLRDEQARQKTPPPPAAGHADQRRQQSAAAAAELQLLSAAAADRHRRPGRWSRSRRRPQQDAPDLQEVVVLDRNRRGRGRHGGDRAVVLDQRDRPRLSAPR